MARRCRRLTSTNLRPRIGQIETASNLYRLWLKGALPFDLWFGVPHRPTRDADFLGFGEMNAKLLATAPFAWRPRE